MFLLSIPFEQFEIFFFHIFCPYFRLTNYNIYVILVVSTIFLLLWLNIYIFSFQIFVPRSEENTSELQSLMRISYAVFCLNKKKKIYNRLTTSHIIYLFLLTLLIN